MKHHTGRDVVLDLSARVGALVVIGWSGNLVLVGRGGLLRV